MAKITRDSLGELAYKQLILMVLNKDLKPGQKVVKKELAKVMDVSQTPVNEAFNRLIKEGILEVRERQGVFVKEFTLEDMKHFYAVRAGLEGIAIYLCLERGSHEELEPILSLFDDFTLPLDEKETDRYRQCDRDFHESILRYAHNPIITDFVSNFELIIKCYQKGLLRQPSETMEEHKTIIAAIRKNDAVLARDLITSHHLKSRDNLGDEHFLRF
jgi:DNA-binding GntR family transcriptional regulator